MKDATVTAQAARNELYDIIRKEVSFEQKAQEALELGRRYLGADSGYLTRIDQSTNHWEVVATTDDADGMVPPGMKADLEGTYCRRTIESNSQISLHDAPNQGWEDDIAFQTYGLHCYHGTSLILDGEPYGTVCFGARDPREQFNDGETMFAELIARLLERELEQIQHEIKLTRQTNLAVVLNRVLRHNLRNDLSVIRGFTQIMADKLDGSQYSTTVLRNIDDLIELAEKARQLDRIIAADFESESTEITGLVEDVVQTITRRYPNASLAVEYDERVTVTVMPSFERALYELIDNAAKHGGDTPTVTVSVEAVQNTVEIRISDDGAGLSEQESDVLQTGSETPLIHGSGLGLWLTHWIVTSHDGTIDATVTDEETRMTITIPRTENGDSHQQQSLTKLRREHDQYQAAFEEANDAMVILNDDGQIINANPEASGIYGLDSHALLGQPFKRFLPNTFDFEGAWFESKNAGEGRDTVTIVGADGVERRVEYAATANVVPGQHLVVSRDITERVEREAELRMKTRAMDKAPVGITLSDPSKDDNPLVYANERFHELTGYLEFAIGRNCRYLQGEETNPKTVARIRQAINAQEPAREIIRNYRKDGTPFWNRLTIAPVTDETGTLTNWVGFQADVTDRIEREQALKTTTQRLQAIIDASPDAILAVDADGTIQLWNDAAEDMLGYSTDEVLGESIGSLGLHSDDQRASFKRKFERALAGETLRNHVITRQTKDGDHIQLRLSTAPVADESAAITGAMGVAKKITGNNTSSLAE